MWALVKTLETLDLTKNLPHSTYKLHTEHINWRRLRDEGVSSVIFF